MKMTTREVELTGGAPWGFRMHGGVDQNQPLRISRRYSDSVERILEVNPGRKASLSGIREGDIISSINGKVTRNMSNAEAHAMLRTSGPVLRLGLNEDREMSPRRRSIGKGSSELKRPSQLIAETQGGKATPQAPVYATVRAPYSPKGNYYRTSPNSDVSNAFTKPTTYEEPVRFHPTNPFYSTLPVNNFSTSSRLPIPNRTFPSFDRNKTKDPIEVNCTEDTKSSSHTNASGPSSLPHTYDKLHTNGYADPSTYNTSNVDQHETKNNDFIRDNYSSATRANNTNNIRDSKNSFDKYVRSVNGKCGQNSRSGVDFYSNEEITERSTITEHKVNTIEEVKTIKKFVLNGNGADLTGHHFSSAPMPSADSAKVRASDGDKGDGSELLKSSVTPFASSVDYPRSPQSSSVKQTVMIAPTFKARSTSPAVWRPGAPTPPPAPAPTACSPAAPSAPPAPPPPPIWTPRSAGASPVSPRKSFRPVHFEETPPSPRREPSLKVPQENGCASGSESEGRLRTSLSAPATGLSVLGTSTSTGSRLPRAQNPTVTLLQKAREGQISRSNYQQEQQDSARLPRDRVTPPSSDPVHALRREYASEGEAERSDHERVGDRRMDAQKIKIDGIGPTTKDGMPVTLRSEVKDPSRWYKKMYDTIHKNKYDDDYVTIRYKNRRGEQPLRPSSNRSQYAYFDPRSGYLSEPEGGLSRLGWSDYDSDVTSPRRRTASVQEDRGDEISPYLPNTKYSTLASARASQEVYKNQPGRIENYVPGKSSVVDKEAKQWWDEVMDIFDGQLSSTTSLPQALPKEKKDVTSAILSKSNMARALKESGYESDSTLVFRRRDDIEAPLSPAERRAAYRDMQAGGEPPLKGFRSPAPQRQESPRRYVESDVNIHYKCPVRRDPLPLVPERELARHQAEHMRRLYREQRRTKYLQDNISPLDIDAFDQSIQELQDMQNRRHQDNFMPSQKAIVPLNRYDETERNMARALYAFVGQTPRELSFKKGDIINVRRQIDANWYEGELHGRIGLFPYNYIELLKSDLHTGTSQPQKKPHVVEGRARAKFDFTAQTNLELPLKKGEIVVLTRRIDHNWWEGRHGTRTGIFPDSYIAILQEPTLNKPELTTPILSTEKPVSSPASHGLVNGTGKRSMGAHAYTPQLNSPALSNAPPSTHPLPGYLAKPAQSTLTPSERGYGPPTGAGVDLNNTEPLYIDTNAEAIPYRAMYKYRPQNPDELELREGDTVYVLEKCDDGWYVGSSQRTGRFGTFPGNYVERI